MSHYNVQPVFEVYADVQGRDLGGVSADVQRVVDSLQPELPRGSTFAIRGQVESMNSSFRGLAFGLLFAVLLVYFLMVVNFQSWLDPFIILTALPGALAGIVWMLYLTQTTISVPALMGAIMCIGVATSNSILLITFANDQRQEGHDATSAALSAGGDPAAAGADDRPGDDHRHAADVAGPGRRRRAERPARPGRHRRPARRHRLHPVLRARHVQPAPPQAAPARGRRTKRTESKPPAPSQGNCRQPTGKPTFALRRIDDELATVRRKTRRRTPGVADCPGVERQGSRPVGTLGAGRRGAGRSSPSAGSLVAATLPRLRHEKELDAAAARAADSPPAVAVATARRAPATSELTLPGNAQPFREAALYARTNGYLKRWLVDIGDRVKEGQLLAEISTPDVDDQLAQARANLVLAKANLQVSEANLELAKITLERDLTSGVGDGAAGDRPGPGPGEDDGRPGRVRQGQHPGQPGDRPAVCGPAIVPEDRRPLRRASSRRATWTRGRWSRPTTPARRGRLFHLMQTDPLRVFVNVPQVYATTVAPGQEAVVYRQEDPLEQFPGKVTRTANALDPNTRTLLTQVDVPNPDDALRPGMYLQVKFVAARATPAVLIPSAALVYAARRDGGRRAGRRTSAVRYRKVQAGPRLRRGDGSGGGTGGRRNRDRPPRRRPDGRAGSRAGPDAQTSKRRGDCHVSHIEKPHCRRPVRGRRWHRCSRRAVRRRSPRDAGSSCLIALQQQNALQQQQNAVQTALQQTTSLLQSAYQQTGLPQQVGTPNPLNFQQQQNAWQIALQQTTALLQASFRQNSALSQTALRQLNTLQTALQQTMTLQSALPLQNGQLTAFQLQTLSQEQTSLMGLLTSQPPSLSRRTSRR